MKRNLYIPGSLCLAFGALFVFCFHVHTTSAQLPFENPGLDEGFNNDPYDVHGCVWGQAVNRNAPELTDDNEVDYHVEEKQAPDEFYLPKQNLGDPCNFYSEPDWKNLKDVGEAALWPAGCFNPINFYDIATEVWQGAYGAFEMNKNYNTWDEFYYAAMGSLNKRTSPPNLDLIFSDKSPAFGTEFTATAATSGYNSRTNQLLYGWATQLPEKGYVSQQGLVAGGRKLTTDDQKDLNFPAGQEGNLDTCKRVTRTVSSGSDRDKDGMDDNWERRYAPNGDITQFKPEDDPDTDGVDISEPSFLHQENKYLQDSEGRDIRYSDAYNGIHVTPDTTAKSRPGDGKFTNMEEFIWGTNPLDPDTDDDGVPDEGDIVGFNQPNYTETLSIGQQQSLTDRMNIRSTVVGISKLLDERNTGHKKILIDSDAKTVIPGIESDLEAELDNLNSTPTATEVTGYSQLNKGQDVFVEADGLRTEGDRSVLDYSWYVEFRNAGTPGISDRVQVPPTPEFTTDDMKKDIGRLGRYTFRHPLTELVKYVPTSYSFNNKPGSFIYITVEISNPVTHEFSKKRIPISIGSDNTMAMNISDLDTGTTMSIEDYVAKYCYDAAQDQVPEPTFCKYGGKTYNEILPWIVFQGSRVEVVAQPIQADTANVVYEWWINEEKVTEAASDVNDNKLVIYPTSDVRDYDVMVVAYTKDEYRNVVFSGEIDMMVEGPQLAITSTPDSATQGTQVQLVGQLLNFPENYVKGSNGYAWTVTLPDGSTQELNGKMVALPSSHAGSYHVELKVSFQSPDGADRTLTAESDLVIGSGTLSAQVKFQKLLASMASIIQQKSRFVYEFALVAAVAIVGMLYFLGYIKKKPAA